MTRIIRILTITVVVIALLMGTSCNQTPQNQTNNRNNNKQTSRKVILTSSNFDEYFDISYSITGSSFSKTLKSTYKTTLGQHYLWDITGNCNLVISIVSKRTLNLDNCSINISIDLENTSGEDYWFFGGDKTKESMTIYLSSSQTTKTISLYGRQSISNTDRNYDAQMRLPGSSPFTPCDISVVGCSGSIYVNN